VKCGLLGQSYAGITGSMTGHVIYMIEPVHFYSSRRCISGVPYDRRRVDGILFQTHTTIG
jgi:hypothetical protein